MGDGSFVDFKNQILTTIHKINKIDGKVYNFTLFGTDPKLGHQDMKAISLTFGMSIHVHRCYNELDFLISHIINAGK